MIGTRKIAGVGEEAMRRRAEWVFDYLDGLVEVLPVPPGHRELLRVHLGEGREQTTEYPELPAIQLPLLVHAAISGVEEPALPVAGACALLYLGADLFDNLADHELPARWHGWNAAEVNLAAATYLSALHQISIARLESKGTSAARLWKLSRLFSETLLTMSAGQHEDLTFPQREDVTPQSCRERSRERAGRK